jgi:hypothetical protein
MVALDARSAAVALLDSRFERQLALEKLGALTVYQFDDTGARRRLEDHEGNEEACTGDEGTRKNALRGR